MQTWCNTDNELLNYVVFNIMQYYDMSSFVKSMADSLTIYCQMYRHEYA